MGQYAQVMREGNGQSRSTSVEGHEETKPTALDRDWKQVEKMRDHVLQNMTDPFDT